MIPGIVPDSGCLFCFNPNLIKMGAYFSFGFFKAAEQLLIRITQGIDRSLGTGGTSQCRLIAAQIAIQTVAQLNHHMRKSQGIFVGFWQKCD